MNTKKSENINVNSLVRIALLLGISFIGAQIKIPSLIGTPALDSFPAYLAAFSLGGFTAAAVAFLGHMFTSLFVGFPMSVPIHIIVALGMSASVLLVHIVAKKYGKISACVIGLIANGLILPAIFIIIPEFGIPFFVGMVPSLLVASALNIGLAYSISPAIDKVLLTINSKRDKVGTN